MLQGMSHHPAAAAASSEAPPYPAGWMQPRLSQRLSQLLQVKAAQKSDVQRCFIKARLAANKLIKGLCRGRTCRVPLSRKCFRNSLLVLLLKKLRSNSCIFSIRSWSWNSSRTAMMAATAAQDRYHLRQAICFYMSKVSRTRSSWHSKIGNRARRPLHTQEHQHCMEGDRHS